MSSRHQQGTSHCITYMTVWGHLQDVKLGRAQDVIFYDPKGICRGHPQDIGQKRPLALHTETYGNTHRMSFEDMLRMSLGHNFAEWKQGYDLFRGLSVFT